MTSRLISVQPVANNPNKSFLCNKNPAIKSRDIYLTRMQPVYALKHSPQFHVLSIRRYDKAVLRYRPNAPEEAVILRKFLLLSFVCNGRRQLCLEKKRKSNKSENRLRLILLGIIFFFIISKGVQQSLVALYRGSWNTRRCFSIPSTIRHEFSVMQVLTSNKLSVTSYAIA